MNPSLEALLSRLPGFDPAKARVTPLQGGITNLNFLVETADAKYVARVFGKNTKILGIDRDNEHACAVIAAGLGIGPEVALRYREYGCLTRYIEGASLSEADFSQPAVLSRVVRTLQRCHAGPSFPGAFDPFKTVRRYHLAAVKREFQFTADLPFHRAIPLLSRIEGALGAARKPAPCHNDLLAGNIIDDGVSIRVVDWEYAAMGDPFFDLGNFAVNQNLSEEGCRLLLSEYFGEVRREDAARLHLYRLVSDLREASWGIVQAAHSELDFDFRAYAAKHLGRFLRGAGGPGFEQSISEAAQLR